MGCRQETPLPVLHCKALALEPALLPGFLARHAPWGIASRLCACSWAQCLMRLPVQVKEGETRRRQEAARLKAEAALEAEELAAQARLEQYEKVCYLSPIPPQTTRLRQNLMVVLIGPSPPPPPPQGFD